METQYLFVVLYCVGVVSFGCVSWQMSKREGGRFLSMLI